MKFIRIVGLALLAACAVGMIASASASATLGIFECEKGTATTGLGSNCLAETGGTFTEKEIIGETFTSKAIGSSVLTQASGTAITCTGGTNEGVVTSRTEDRATIKFTGCTATGGSACSSTGASAKEIVSPVSSKIVSYLENGTTLRAGLLLAPRNAANQNLQSNITCGTLAVEVRGSVIGAISPEDVMSQSFTVKFALNASNKQVIPDTVKPFEAKIGATGSFEAATEKAETLLDFPLKVEIMG